MEREDSVVFISYSHGEDDIWRDRLRTHLEGFAWTKSQLNVFVDTKLVAGEDWERKIDEAIGKTAVAVLLISPNFLRSKFIREKELPLFLEKNRRYQMPIVPIIVEPCAWKETEISKLLVRPNDGNPLSAFGVRDQQTNLVEIAREINQLYVRQIDQENQITIVVADDREFTVRGLRDLFEDDLADDMTVVAMAVTPQDTERHVVNFAPDILLLDMSWYRDDEAGFRIMERVKRTSPITKIIAISNHSDLLNQAAEKGVQTLDKDFTILELFDKIREVNSNDHEILLEKNLFENLTDREIEVLALVAQGLQDKEIQNKLVVSLSTVKKHISNVLAKTGTKTRTEAAVKAREYKVI